MLINVGNLHSQLINTFNIQLLEISQIYFGSHTKYNALFCKIIRKIQNYTYLHYFRLPNIPNICASLYLQCFCIKVNIGLNIKYTQVFKFLYIMHRI